MKLLFVLSLPLLIGVYYVDRQLPDTIYFREGATFAQVEEALNGAHPFDDIYYTAKHGYTDGTAFIYVHDRSVEQRAESFWQAYIGILERHSLTPPPQVILDCWVRHDCPAVEIDHVMVRNAPTSLDTNPIVLRVERITAAFAVKEIVRSFFP